MVESELFSQFGELLHFETKRDFIESMGIKVWLDGENVDITGVIDTNIGVIVPTPS